LDHARFARAARFHKASFEQVADFGGAQFTEGAIFYGVSFRRDAYFLWANFGHGADFKTAGFALDADFTGATFVQAADFSMATFLWDANFSGAKFLAALDFLETVFSGDPILRQRVPPVEGPALEGRPAIFSFAQFEKPELVTFYKTYLGRALFHNRDVSSVVFSDVAWLRRPGSGKRMVFEEVVDLNDVAAMALKPGQGDANERNYGLIAEIYQQLKKNYDDPRDYWTAGDFHYGEMEMKRLSSRHENRILRWLHRHLGLVASYKYASEYGESYTRPAGLLLFFLLVFFPLLYPLIGLRAGMAASAAASAARTQPAHNEVILSYCEYIRSGAPSSTISRLTIWELLGNGLTASVDTALLQRQSAYEPAGPWGWALSRLELILTSTLFALFLLAVRRQFRR